MPEGIIIFIGKISDLFNCGIHPQEIFHFICFSKTRDIN